MNLREEENFEQHEGVVELQELITALRLVREGAKLVMEGNLGEANQRFDNAKKQVNDARKHNKRFEILSRDIMRKMLVMGKRFTLNKHLKEI